MKTKTYSLEVDLTGYDIVRDDEGPWASAEMLVAEGSTLDELIETAQVFFIDQDGGSAFDCPFDGSYMSSKQYDMIEQELKDKFNKEINNVRTS